MDESFKSMLWGALDEAKTPSAVKTVDGEAVKTPVTNLDADTVKADGQSYRIKGFNAPEVAHIKGGIFVPGQVADDQTQENINKLAAIGGYTDLQTTGKDKYGRVLAEQTNPNTKRTLGEPSSEYRASKL